MKMYVEDLFCLIKENNDLFSGGGGTEQHTQMVWIFGKGIGKTELTRIYNS